MLARGYISVHPSSLHLPRPVLAASGDSGAPRRWPSLLPPGSGLEAPADCNELWSTYRAESPGSDVPDAPLGRLDRETADLRQLPGARLGLGMPLHTRSGVRRCTRTRGWTVVSIVLHRDVLPASLGDLVHRGVYVRGHPN